MNRIIDYIIALDERKIEEFNGQKGYWITHFGHKIFIPEGTKEEKRKFIRQYFENVRKYNNVQKKYFTPSDNDKEVYNKDYKKFEDKKLKPNETLSVGKTPDIYTKLNLLPQLPLKIAEHKLDFAMGGDAEHNIAKGDLKKLPELITDPIMIFKSRRNKQDTSNKSIIAVIDLKDLSQRPVFAILNSTSGGINIILSTYGRKNFNDYFEKDIKVGNLVYVDSKRASKTILPSELQLLKMYSAKGSNFNIAKKEDIVKSFMENEKVSEDEINDEISSFVLDSLNIKDNINNKSAYLKGYFIAIDRLDKKEEDIAFNNFVLKKIG